MLNIFVEGCGHGRLSEIYAAIASRGQAVDLVIICGDFQAVRAPADLNCMSVPVKYRSMETFHEYYSGAKVAPYLTLVVGGNHEASNHLRELPHGGWLAPHIYYVGDAGVVQVKGVRIGGLSGIFDAHDYDLPRFESVPYNASTLRSVYHLRRADVAKLALISGPLHVMVSHDWPQGIERYGDIGRLLKFKPHLEHDIRVGRLGSPPAMELLLQLRPQHWFAAHLHTRFSAVVAHGNPDEIELDEDVASAEALSFSETRFLALDKCLPRRRFLEQVTLQTDSDQALSYDPQWLAITRAQLRGQVLTPESVATELAWIKDNVHDLRVPSNFERSDLSPYGPNDQPPVFDNVQTRAFLGMLKL